MASLGALGATAATPAWATVEAEAVKVEVLRVKVMMVKAMKA